MFPFYTHMNISSTVFFHMIKFYLFVKLASSDYNNQFSRPVKLFWQKSVCWISTIETINSVASIREWTGKSEKKKFSNFSVVGALISIYMYTCKWHKYTNLLQIIMITTAMSHSSHSSHVSFVWQPGFSLARSLSSSRLLFFLFISLRKERAW